MTTSRLKEYKDNDFNEVIRRAESLLKEKNGAEDQTKLAGEITGEAQAQQKAPITPQDIQLSQNYLSKVLTIGDISKKINQLLPKISPTFKGDNFTITKISPIKSKDPNTVQFKVNFALQSGSNKANKFLDSQDLVIQKASKFLQSLNEEQLSEGVFGAIGSAVASKATLGNYEAAKAKEPMLGQYLQKVLTQAFQDVVPINGKNFDINIGNIKAEISNQGEADKLEASKAEAEQKEQRDAKIAQVKQKAKDTATAVGKGIAKGAKAVGKGIAKGAKAITDNIKAAAKSSDYGQNSEEEIKTEGFDEKLHEGLMVRDGSFIVKMTLANTPQATEAAPETPVQPQQQAAPQQPAQPVQQGSNNPNTINIYANGNGNLQQPGQQQNNTPFWWSQASNRQKKKYIKNMTGNIQGTSKGGWLSNNTYGSQIGNSPTSASGWK